MSVTPDPALRSIFGGTRSSANAIAPRPASTPGSNSRITHRRCLRRCPWAKRKNPGKGVTGFRRSAVEASVAGVRDRLACARNGPGQGMRGSSIAAAGYEMIVRLLESAPSVSTRVAQIVSTRAPSTVRKGSTSDFRTLLRRSGDAPHPFTRAKRSTQLPSCRTPLRVCVRRRRGAGGRRSPTNRGLGPRRHAVGGQRARERGYRVHPSGQLPYRGPHIGCAPADAPMSADNEASCGTSSCRWSSATTWSASTQ